MHTDGLDIACQDICDKSPINERGLIHVDSGKIYSRTSMARTPLGL